MLNNKSLLILLLITVICTFIACKSTTPERTAETSVAISTKITETVPTTYHTESTTSHTISPDYILNTNTMKFHYPDCSSVDKIKSSNRIDYTGDRETPLSLGYSPCKRCFP